jgi:alcohol dehydrogenase
VTDAVPVADLDPIRRPVAYGNGAIHRLPELVERLGARRLLLVTGQRSFAASGAAEVVPDLEQLAEVHRWCGFEPNTDAADLAIGLSVVEELDPDVVVGIGGGSAMDMAKLLCAYRGTTREDRLRDAIRCGRPVRRDGVGLVLVPTTSGSGSEATHFAVVYVDADKHSIADRSLLPDAVVLDPRLATSGSPYQRATSGIDAVAQAIESLWATAATDRSRSFARHALRLLLPHLEPFVREAAPRSARAMAIGSHLAGRAIDVSRTTAAHALSYGITKGHGVSHGHAVALTLGPFIAAHGAATPGSLREDVDPQVHAAVMTTIVTRLGARDPAGAHERFTDLMVRVGLEPRLSAAAGVTTADQRAALVAAVNLERLGNNPVAFDADGLTTVLELAR